MNKCSDCEDKAECYAHMAVVRDWQWQKYVGWLCTAFELADGAKRLGYVCRACKHFDEKLEEPCPLFVCKGW